MRVSFRQPFHIGRIYLLGNNQPAGFLGGSWELPSQVPRRLASTLKKEQFASLW